MLDVCRALVVCLRPIRLCAVIDVNRDILDGVDGECAFAYTTLRDGNRCASNVIEVCLGVPSRFISDSYVNIRITCMIGQIIRIGFFCELRINLVFVIVFIGRDGLRERIVISDNPVCNATAFRQKRIIDVLLFASFQVQSDLHIDRANFTVDDIAEFGARSRRTSCRCPRQKQANRQRESHSAKIQM